MKDAEKTIGNLIDHASVSIIGSVDEAGFPNTKAMLPPRKRTGVKHIYFTTNTSSMFVTTPALRPITACDAAYLELALRTGPPLPSLDDGLNAAATGLGIAPSDG